MRHNFIDDSAGLDYSGPPYQHRNAESTFGYGTFFALERMIATIRPAKDLGAIVTRKQHDRVVGNAKIVKLLQQLANLPIQLPHAVGVKTKSALALPFRREMGPYMHARSVMP